MRSTPLLPFLLATLATALPISEEHFPRPCAPLHVIVARGSCESGDILSNYGEGSFYKVADMITTEVEGANSFGLVYPATGIDDCPTPVYADSETAGVRLLKQDIVNYVTRCPKSKIALVGYSQGGQVVGDAMCGASEGGSFSVTEPLDEEYADHVVAAIIFGDPAYKAGQTYNIGTAGTASGMIPRTSTASCRAFSKKLKSYCNAGDPVCSKGHNMDVHWSYRETNGAQAAKFVLQRYKRSVDSDEADGDD